MSLSQQELSQVIRLARPLLILFICLAHTPYISGYLSEHSQPLDIASLFPVILKDFFARGGVPILSVISGYLVVHSFKKYTYVDFLRNKFTRLMVPFMVWNAIALALMVIAAPFVGGETFNGVMDYISAIFGFQRLPINPPTYFLRDLFLMMVLAPLIHVLCKKIWVLLTAVVVYIFIFWNQPGITFYIDGTAIPLTFRADSILFFTLGYFLALHNIQIPRFSGYNSIASFILITVIGVFTSMLLTATNPSGGIYVIGRALIGALFVLIAPAIFWGLLAIRSNIFGRLLERLSPYSFTLFLTHILSAQVFILLTRHQFKWFVNESFPIWQQTLYILSYLVFVSVAAVITLKVWQCFLGKLNLLKANAAQAAG